jgi:myo-inositol-1(or 4)-monophosphatase
MNPSNKILDHMLLAIQKGEEVLNHYFGRVLTIDKKDKAGLVTQADRESETVITQALKNFGYPFAMLGEESYYEQQKKEILSSYLDSSEPCWILDPLDGTTNFVHGFPVFAISLALYHKGETRIAVVSAPKMGALQAPEVYTAIQGQGAFCSGVPLVASSLSLMKEAFLATGFFAEDSDQLKEQLPIFQEVLPQCRGIRRAGAAAYDLALVARGTFDAFWERGLKPWDTAAGTLLVREAGGVVETYKGLPFHPGYNSIVAGSSPLVSHLQGIMKNKIRNITD